MGGERKGRACSSHSVTCQVDVCVQVPLAGGNREEEYTCLGNSQKYRGESNGREEVETKEGECFGSLLEETHFGEYFA